MGILDSTGTSVVEYKYDAWGKPLSTTGTLATTLGVENPFRYRGYVYDEETGYYYLRSRYYDPRLRRFVSEDSIVGTGLMKSNVFLYCANNPVRNIDPSGKDCSDGSSRYSDVPRLISEYYERKREKYRMWRMLQQMQEGSGGCVTLINGTEIYYVKADLYNEIYRKENSSLGPLFLDAGIIIGGKIVEMFGLQVLGKAFAQIAVASFLLNAVSKINSAYNGSLVDAPGSVGIILIHNPRDLGEYSPYAMSWIPYEAQSQFEDFFNNIDSIELY